MSACVPKVSVVVASFMHERFVGETFASIAAQTFRDFEVVVVDDGSTDRTPAIAREFAERDPRFRVHARENRGVVAARNEGVALSRGEFVSIVDSDDLLPAERLAWQVEALDANPRASIVYGDAWIVDEAGRRLGTHHAIYPPVAGDFSVELFANHCFTPAISVMFRRAAFEASGPLWGPGPSTDYLKWIELGLFGEAVCLADRKLGCWRKHGANESMGDVAKRVRQYGELRDALAELLRRRPELAARVGELRAARRLARCRFMAGFYAGLGGEWGIASEQFRLAAQDAPTAANLLARVSALPGIRKLSAPAYRAVARRKLGPRL